jgi:uncharacterized protein (DUF488 family)
LSEEPIEIWTVGHSTRSAEDFLHLLTSNSIEVLVDVRSFPSSKRHPQFNKAALEEFLKAEGIRYLHFPGLGGRRTPLHDSINTAWQNAGFRGYADYMQTAAFEKAIKELLEVASNSRTAIMCAEAVWWRCHRSLIADYLKAKEVEVVHILDVNKTESHPFTSVARIIDGQLSYRGLI